jgi:hypothetical protein
VSRRQGEIYASGAIGLDCSRYVEQGKRYLVPQIAVKRKKGGSGQRVVLHLSGGAAVFEDQGRDGLIPDRFWGRRGRLLVSGPIRRWTNFRCLFIIRRRLNRLLRRRLVRSHIGCFIPTVETIVERE